MAATPPSNPSSEPTDRSISPEMITNTMPHASMPVIDICRSRFDRLRGVTNAPSVRKEKKIQMTVTASSNASNL